MKSQDADSDQLWNDFIERISDPNEPLDEIQRPAQLAFLYESEVQNGGHLQYFENVGAEKVGETVAALKLLGAGRQETILRESGQVFLGMSRERAKTAEEYVAAAREGEFDRFDKSFGACSPTLIECLERYLKAHLGSFFTVN